MDWTRAGLKTQAKDFLRTRYWYAFLVSWIAGMLGGGSSGIGSVSFQYRFDSTDNPFKDFPLELIIIFVIFFLLAFLFGIAFSMFVGAPIRIGSYRWFSRARDGEDPSRIGLLFSLFKKGQYLPSVGAYAWMSLWYFLWTLPSILLGAAGMGMLFLSSGGGRFTVSGNPVFLGIGIVLIACGIGMMTVAYAKYYAYCMTPWILADKPDVGYRRAIRLSIAMTKGSKMDIFVLDLSFMLWYLAGFAACCIGVLFVIPYVTATQAALYATLKHHAILRGDCTPEELGYASATASAPTPGIESAPAEEGTPA